jgi:5-hydroxyisourate hydrolase
VGFVTLSTHVLDAAAGRPAPGVAVRLESLAADGTWAAAGSGRTDADGRLRDWLPAGTPGAGRHRLVFGTGAYFTAAGVAAFFPEVVVDFEVTAPDEHHHVQLLLSQFAYSTYRGS